MSHAILIQPSQEANYLKLSLSALFHLSGGIKVASFLIYAVDNLLRHRISNFWTTILKLCLERQVEQ